MINSKQNGFPTANGGQTFSEEQQQYLEGFVAGSNLLRQGNGLPGFQQVMAGQQARTNGQGNGFSLNGHTQPVQQNGSTTNGAHNGVKLDAAPGLVGPLTVHAEAQDKFLLQKKKLSAEEMAKRAKNPFTMWEEMQKNADQNTVPKGTDVFLYKYHGLFHVAPAQNSFMCRMRFAGGILKSHQFREVASIAEDCGGGYVHVTTRANLQIREIEPKDTMQVLTRLADAGIIIRGSGSDNIRNITGAPTAGIDPQEIIDTRPLTQHLHHTIINTPDMYGLPRKFNIAFDGGSSISVLEDTNDIGFVAMKVSGDQGVEPGIYFRLELGGITGHKDFAKDTGVMVAPKDCTAVSIAILRVFLKNGDRTDRKKARLKYVLDNWGVPRFLEEVEKEYGQKLIYFPLEKCEPRQYFKRNTHVGVHSQKQAGLNFIGVALPVGRLLPDQIRGLAQVSESYGTGTIRLTVWQNLLLSDIRDADVQEVLKLITDLGLTAEPNHFQAGLVACTGNAGCKYAAADTKRHGMQVIEHLQSRFTLDQALNIHVTGCHHSCAQHYIGDIGLIGAKVTQGDDDDAVELEGYHMFLGGGFGDMQAIGTEFQRDITAEELPLLIEKMMHVFHELRTGPEESFAAFTRRIDLTEFKSRVQALEVEEARV